MEEDDEHAHDDGRLDEGEHQAQQLVQPAQHGQFEHALKNVAQQGKQENDQGEDNDERDDVHVGGGDVEIF